MDRLATWIGIGGLGITLLVSSVPLRNEAQQAALGQFAFVAGWVIFGAGIVGLLVVVGRRASRAPDPPLPPRLSPLMKTGNRNRVNLTNLRGRGYDGPVLGHDNQIEGENWDLDVKSDAAPKN